MRAIGLVIAFILCNLCSLAQTEGAYSWPDKGVWPESPKAATIREVTSPLPALLTGAAEFTVPLYSLEAEGMTLPFEFRYHSNGIRVHDDPCPWGYGWTLSPSIRVSRRIIGRPDGLFTPADYSKDVLTQSECYHAMNDSMLDLSGWTPRRYPDFYTDPAPDIFTVQLPGKQFSVIFQKTETGYEAVTAACEEYRIETDDFLTWFRITDPTGCIYTFDVGGEYSLAPIFRTEWFPGSIELPSGSKINFSYIDCTSALHNMAELVPPHYTFVNGDANPSPGGTVAYTHPYFRDGKHLASVEFEGKKVSLTYDGTREGERCIKNLVATIDGKEVSRADFTYDANRKMLQSIVTPEGEYAFEYDPHTFHEGSGRDWWGYSNGKGGGSPRLYADLRSLLSNSLAHIEHMGSDRNIDAANMQARMLVKATYPTGGSARWEYEPHSFDPIGPATVVGRYISNATELSEGGGLRVKSVSLYENDDDPAPQITRFYYGENRDGKAVCLAAPTLDTFIDGYRNIEFCQAGIPGLNLSDPFLRDSWHIFISAESNYMQYRFGEVPIWYSCVETVNEEGKTVTRFEDLIGDSEYYNSATNFVNWPTELFHVFSEGPQMISRTVYRSSPSGSYSPVATETMEYELADGHTCRGHHIKRLKHSSPQIISAPDFSGTERVDYSYNNIYTLSARPPGAVDCAIDGRGYYYILSPEGIYSRRAFNISPLREQLISKTVTEYRDNGSYTVSQNMEYVEGTGLVARVTDSVIPDKADTGKRGAADIVSTFTYADASTGEVESAMVAANIIGVPLRQTVQDNTGLTSVRAQMNRYGDAGSSRVFRPSRVYRSRGTADEYYTADLTWSAHGNLLSSTDLAGTAIAYTWDSRGRYPIAMSTGGLTSHAEWEPGVGVTSLTTPAGIRSVYAYDRAGRLVSSGIDGHGTLMSWEYVISHSGDNYVKEITRLRAGPATDAPYRRSNHDGLGRAVSEVTAWKADGWRYIAAGTDYDSMGRPRRQWASVPVDSDNPDIAGIESSASEFYDDTEPYALTTYEASQRRMPVSTHMAGEQWHRGDHRSTVRHLVNDGDAYACACYELGSGMNLMYRGNYARGSLTVEETVDEDGITEATFTDFRGRRIMHRRGAAKTYYVYNDYGDLCYILPPDIPEKSYTNYNSTLQKQAYIYRYDSRGRLISAKMPGCNAAEFIYDTADRLVAENNADLGGKWRLHFYDSVGREVLVTEATIPTDGADRANLAQPRTVTRGTSAADGLKGYLTDFSFPADNQARTAVYYDDYTLLPALGGDNTKAYLSKPSGLMTGMWAASDDGGRGVDRIYWYDRLGRKSFEIIDTDPYRLCRTISYTYSGQVSTQVEHVYDTSTSPWRHWEVHREYEYDDTGAPKSESVTLDSCTVVTNYSYDAAGRLKHTARGLSQAGTGISGGATISGSRVSRDYTYDVHGWPVKIVTGVPLTLKPRPQHPQPGDIALPYYAAAATSFVRDSIALLIQEKFTEKIYYADGATPRYNGTPSARDLTAGGRYDYRYDSLDRLIAADYTAPADTSDADFSTEYAYDILSRPTSIKRRGVVDIDGMTEIFGQLDNLTISYDGALPSSVQSEITDDTGRRFYGRTGWIRGTFVPKASLKFNTAGRLKEDAGRTILSLSYNTLGLPLCYTMGNDDTAPHMERAYDATGSKLRQTVIDYVRGVKTKMSDRRYLESFTFNADTLERIDFNGGYFDGQGNAHFLLPDWQGNVTITTDARGRVEQHIGYYPYGEPWREPSGQHATLYAAKERTDGIAAGEYDFGPRGYQAPLLLWGSPDSNSPDYPWWSPWLYCGANPIRHTDPTGNDIVLFGQNDSQLVIATSLLDEHFNLSSWGIDWGGEYILHGDNIVSAALDIVGIFDPTGIADVANCGLQLNNGEWLGAGISLLGAVLPGVGDAAKGTRIKADYNTLNHALQGIQFNRKIGKVAEEAVTKKLTQQYGNNALVGTQITARFDDGTRVVFDNVVVEGKEISLISETKASVNGVSFRLSPQQERFFIRGEKVTFVGERAEQLSIKGRSITKTDTKTSISFVTVTLK